MRRKEQETGRRGRGRKQGGEGEEGNSDEKKVQETGRREREAGNSEEKKEQETVRRGIGRKQ